MQAALAPPLAPPKPSPSPPSNPTIAKLPTIETAYEEFIGANGKLDLAAERLHITPPQLTLLLTQNFTTLQQTLRSLLLLNLFDTVSTLGHTLASRIEHLEPADLAKTYTQTANIITTLTAPTPASSLTLNQNNINVQDLVFKMLPPEARDALRILMEPDDAVIDVEPT